MVNILNCWVILISVLVIIWLLGVWLMLWIKYLLIFIRLKKKFLRWLNVVMLVLKLFRVNDMFKGCILVMKWINILWSSMVEFLLILRISCFVSLGLWCNFWFKMWCYFLLVIDCVDILIDICICGWWCKVFNFKGKEV